MRYPTTVLVADIDGDGLQEAVLVYPQQTETLVVIDFAIADWAKLHTRSGRLERFVVPRTLEAATD